MARELGDGECEEDGLVALAGAYRVAGDLAAALHHALLGAATHRPGNRPLARAEALTELGRVLHATGRTAEARQRWQAARRLYLELDHPAAADVDILISSSSAS
jgi:hypothetical protein